LEEEEDGVRSEGKKDFVCLHIFGDKMSEDVAP